MKKIFGIILAFAVSFTLYLTGNAVDVPKISDINESFWLESMYSVYRGNGENITDLSQLSLVTGEELLILLPTEAFLNDSGLAYRFEEKTTVTPEMLYDAGIEVRFRAEAGAAALEKIDFTIQMEKTAISIEFVKELALTKNTLFDYTLYLTVDGKKRAATEIRLVGQIGNPVIQVEKDEYVDLSGGEVAEALAYIKNIEVDLGNGASAYSSFYEGFRYYGVARVETEDDKYPLLEDYPEVTLIYTLRTIGLKQEGMDIISFDLPDVYHVYDKNGYYLGTTSKRLPYSSTYYLTTVDIGYIEFPDY